ncbi:Transmembrane amino acid transporter protein [Tritrichomonas foetus]|uniref:Transmembrane amino acid transporter protein n=1 Tax=Tritrichomonas foetus TaxID=1144522 RepID=A0A1J4J1Z5_9EUKA|nr:Transmembrane amino acid transporter protein [Tritrichomonas foetus]|eukprot:OHS93394.1 Transmembrane amino acid transporter protein [Tritrichomonas foetus]
MIGGDIIIKDFKKQRLKSNGDVVLFHNTKETKSVSFFLVLNLMCKAGIATNPYLVGEAFFAGTIQTVIYVVCLLLLNELSFFLFIKSWIYGRAYSYDSICTELFGPHFSWLVLLGVIIIYLTFVIWTEYEIYAYLGEFILSLWPNAPSILNNQWFITYILTFVVVFPTLFVKKLSSFAYMALASNIFHVIVLALLITYYFKYIYNVPGAFQNEIIYFSSNPSSSFTCISILNNALFYQPVLATLIKDLDNPTRKRTMKLTWLTSIISVSFHFIGGFFSYICSPINNGDISLIFLNPKAPEIIAGKILVYMISLFSNIFFTNFISHQLAKLIDPVAIDSTIPVVFSGIVILLLSIGLNFVNEMITTITDYIANVACIILVFVLPPLYYLKQYGFSDKLWGAASVVLMAIGIPVGLLTLYYGLDDF